MPAASGALLPDRSAWAGEPEDGSEWRTIDLPGRGTTFACDRPGPSRSAPTVVLLHGWTATGRLNWASTIAALAGRYRVIALDHRGHGRGIRSEDAFTLEDCADDVVALLDAVGVPTAIFVGYSMGGPIAQLIWRRHRDRVSGLVLCATAADFTMTPDYRPLVRAVEEMQRAAGVIPRPVRWQMTRALSSAGWCPSRPSGTSCSTRSTVTPTTRSTRQGGRFAGSVRRAGSARSTCLSWSSSPSVIASYARHGNDSWRR